MATVDEIRTTRETTGRRNVMRALQLGTVLQSVCLALPLLDLWLFGSVERHVRAAYPDWPAQDLALDRNAIVGGLVAVSVLGILGWLGALWSAKRDRGVRATVTTLVVVGASVLAGVAGLSGGAYDPVVPLWLGTASLALPVLPGLAALVAAWARRAR